MPLKLIVIFQIVCFITLSLVQNSLQNNVNQSRIVGGVRAATREFPYIVVLLIAKKDGNGKKCTGSIITAQWMLTAAHCYRGVGSSQKGTSVIAAAIDFYQLQAHSQERKSVQIIVHDVINYRKNFEMDVALVKVNQPFVFNVHVKPITLARAPFPSRGRVECQSMGYGRIDNDGKIQNTNLYSLNVLTGDFLFCKELNRHLDPSNEFLCVAPNPRGASTCKGDSGGPLICQGLLAGVLSGKTHRKNGKTSEKKDKSCSGKTAVSVYMFVGNFEKWMRRYIPELPEFKLLKTSKTKLKSIVDNYHNVPEASSSNHLFPNVCMCVIITLSIKRMSKM